MHIKMFQKLEGSDSLVFRIWSSAKPRPIKMSVCNFLGKILSTSMFTKKKKFKIFHSVQEIEPFSLFQYLALGKASTDDKCHFAIPWPRSFQHQIVYNILSKYSKRLSFHFFFQNLNLGKTSTNSKCHLTISWAISCQYTNVYTKFHHNIPLSSRDRAIFTFSEFGARQNLDQ